MDRKVLSIILGLAFIASFFLPYYGLTGLEELKLRGGGGNGNSILTYLWLIFPLSGLMLLIGAMTNNYPGGRALWCWLPFLTIIFILIVYPLIEGAKVGQIFSKAHIDQFGPGMWIVLVASIIGIAYNPRS